MEHRFRATHPRHRVLPLGSFGLAYPAAGARLPHSGTRSASGEPQGSGAWKGLHRKKRAPDPRGAACLGTQGRRPSAWISGSRESRTAHPARFLRACVGTVRGRSIAPAYDPGLYKRASARRPDARTVHRPRASSLLGRFRNDPSGSSSVTSSALRSPEACRERSGTRLTWQLAFAGSNRSAAHQSSHPANVRGRAIPASTVPRVRVRGRTGATD